MAVNISPTIHMRLCWSGWAWGMERCGLERVTVNEQNPQAIGFYRHMGFQTYRRTECDQQGRPYPLLYMRLIGARGEEARR